MKKTLIVLGGIFGFLIIVGLVGFAILAVKGSALDNEGRTYVDDVAPKILMDLSKETLLRYASSELKQATSSEEIDRLFTWFTKLGQFKEYKGSTGQAFISFTTEKGKQITGTYQAQVEFESGPATVKVVTIKKGDHWEIMGFHINSNALMPQ